MAAGNTKTDETVLSEPSGEVFVVSAPSGVGKTTLCRKVCERLEGLVYSVSYTTRPPRRGEVHGRDYFFVDEMTFDEMVRKGCFVEWARVYEYCYGTSRQWVMDQIHRGLDVILDVDVQGAHQIRRAELPAHHIFLLPPSWEVLEERLTKRGTEDPEEIRTRLGWARKELESWEAYDFLIVNDELEEAVRDLEAVIRAQRCRLQRRRPWVRRKMVEEFRRG